MRLARSPDWAQMGYAARGRYEKLFSPQAGVYSYAYQRVAAKDESKRMARKVSPRPLPNMMPIHGFGIELTIGRGALPPCLFHTQATCHRKDYAAKMRCDSVVSESHLPETAKHLFLSRKILMDETTTIKSRTKRFPRRQDPTQIGQARAIDNSLIWRSL